MKTRHYYSQNGEDIILWSLFSDQMTPGFFIDVGALDGLRFSNTYSFEEAGWCGVCIEAHPVYIESLRRNRPNSIVVHAAIGDQDRESVDFYASDRESLSTLNPLLKEEPGKSGYYFTGWDVKNVPIRTLNTILEENHIKSPIDIVSIDNEGKELLALYGFNLRKYRPRAFVIKVLDGNVEAKLDAYLEKFGYIQIRRIANSVFYCHCIFKIPT